MTLGHLQFLVHGTKPLYAAGDPYRQCVLNTHASFHFHIRYTLAHNVFGG
jgi:hypothetical protein